MLKSRVLSKRNHFVPVGNIVELIGPPGIGKSTIYNTACSKWKKSDGWIHEDELYAPSLSPLSSLTDRMVHAIRRLTGKKYNKSLPLNYGMDFVNQHPKLAEFIWDHLGKNHPGKNQVAYRYRAAYFLFLTFSRYQGIIREKSFRPVLLEEGFLQKSFLVNPDEEYMSSILDKYLPLIPMPIAVICLKAPNRKLILERIRMRGKTIAAHEGKTDLEILQEIHQWERLNVLICRKLSKVGVRISYLDGRNTLGENVAELSRILKELN